eukprot:scaffold12767_cov16-Tisochrysis_lutea.AAC.1
MKSKEDALQQATAAAQDFKASLAALEAEHRHLNAKLQPGGVWLLRGGLSWLSDLHCQTRSNERDPAQYVFLCSVVLYSIVLFAEKKIASVFIEEEKRKKKKKEEGKLSFIASSSLLCCSHPALPFIEQLAPLNVSTPCPQLTASCLFFVANQASREEEGNLANKLAAEAARSCELQKKLGKTETKIQELQKEMQEEKKEKAAHASPTACTMERGVTALQANAAPFTQ